MTGTVTDNIAEYAAGYVPVRPVGAAGSKKGNALDKLRAQAKRVRDDSRVLVETAGTACSRQLVLNSDTLRSDMIACAGEAHAAIDAVAEPPVKGRTRAASARTAHASVQRCSEVVESALSTIGEASLVMRAEMDKLTALNGRLDRRHDKLDALFDILIEKYVMAHPITQSMTSGVSASLRPPDPLQMEHIDFRTPSRVDMVYRSHLPLVVNTAAMDAVRFVMEKESGKGTGKGKGKGRGKSAQIGAEDPHDTQDDAAEGGAGARMVLMNAAPISSARAKPRRPKKRPVQATADAAYPPATRRR
jgi:hypothetical protein